MPKNDIRYGLSSFKTIRENSHRYVDKTESIFKLISSYDYVFLSRPRRFGKTLLVDTLSEIFQGNKKLFKGLSIYKKKYDWKAYPVIRLDMSKPDLSSPESLETSLQDMLQDVCKSLKIKPATLTSTKTPKSYLSSIITQIASSQQKVVILIDEYDYPVINHLHEGEKVTSSFLKVLQQFYLALKVNSNFIHFLLLTGVTKLALTSIFSGLNNLKDISYLPKFCDLLGYTQKELESNFEKEIIRGAKSHSLTQRSFLNKVKEWYDGFRFSTKKLSVYNPSDINQFFQDGSIFKNYWIKTGTPSFILELLAKYPNFDLLQELNRPKSNFFDHNVLDLDFEISKCDIIPLLYQSGYITVKNLNENGQYYLGFPNKEVKIAFTKYLASSLFNKKEKFFSQFISITETLVKGDPRQFVEKLDILFKSLSHPTQKYQKNAIRLAISTILSLSQDIDVENQIHSGKGITDVVAITKDTIYIMELKVDGSATQALNQIKAKDYINIYTSKPKYKKKKIVLMGISFNSKDATVKEFKIEPQI